MQAHKQVPTKALSWMVCTKDFVMDEGRVGGSEGETERSEVDQKAYERVDERGPKLGPR